MYIQLAPGKLKAGISEDVALKASDEFEENFNQKVEESKTEFTQAKTLQLIKKESQA